MNKAGPDFEAAAPRFRKNPNPMHRHLKMAFFWALCFCALGAARKRDAGGDCAAVSPAQVAAALSGESSSHHERVGRLVSSLLYYYEARALLDGDPAACENLKGVTGISNSADLKTACVLRYHFYNFLSSAFDAKAEARSTADLCGSFFRELHSVAPTLPEMPEEGCRLLSEAYKKGYSNICTRLALLVPPNDVFDTHFACRTLLYPDAASSCSETKQADLREICATTAIVLDALRSKESKPCGDSLICRAVASRDRNILGIMETDLRKNYCKYENEKK